MACLATANNLRFDPADGLHSFRLFIPSWYVPPSASPELRDFHEALTEMLKHAAGSALWNYTIDGEWKSQDISYDVGGKAPAEFKMMPGYR